VNGRNGEQGEGKREISELKVKKSLKKGRVMVKPC
jgi:hypothetical protein